MYRKLHIRTEGLTERQASRQINGQRQQMDLTGGQNDNRQIDWDRGQINQEEDGHTDKQSSMPKWQANATRDLNKT